MKDIPLQHFLHLFSCVHVSIGFNRSLLIDDQRNQYWFIPNKWAYFLSERMPIQLQTIYNEFDVFYERKETNKFLQFLTQNELIFTHQNNCSNLFPPVEKTHHTPSLIETISITCVTSKPLISNELLNELGVQNLVLHCEKQFNINELINHYKHARISGIEIIVDYAHWDKNELKSLVESELRIHVIHFQNSPHRKNESVKGCRFAYYANNGFKTNHRFRISSQLIIESEQWHTYFNRRLHITQKGEIKNAAHTSNSFGHINSNPIKTIQSAAFQALWKVKKTVIDDCSQCEFRLICVDKRPLIKRKDNKWFSEEECTYNPFLCKEIGQEGYHNLKACGISSSAIGFKIETEKFIKIKQETWESSEH